MERFWKKVDKTDSCWNWTACRDKDGYGVAWFNKRKLPAHRLSWILEHGTIPDNMQVLHTCDNTSCIKPSHLFLGTTQDNTEDREKKKRGAKGEGHGCAKLTWDKVHEIRSVYPELSQQRLADKYHVSKRAIQFIVTNKHWIEG